VHRSGTASRRTLKALVVRPALLLPVLLLLGSCQGSIGNSLEEDSDIATPGGGPGPGGDPSQPADCTKTDTGPSVLRRLSKLEYRLTLQDLFHLPAPPEAAQVPEDGQQDGFHTIAALQNVSDGHLRAYLEVAETLGKELMADAPRRQAVLGCDAAQAACLKTFITTFGKLAYRRSLDDQEASALANKAVMVGRSNDDRFQFVVESLLTSPSFLFRVEIGDNAEVATLQPTELASRLSFTLWGRSPSADLIARAERGELDSAEGLGAAARQMVSDPKTQEFFQAFFKQWLNFAELRTPKKAPPRWSEALLPEMIHETELVLNEFAWTPGVPFTGALTTNHTYVTPALGAFYGMNVAGTGSVRTEFAAGHARQNTGLLTHASLISAKSDSDLIASRGKWIRSAFLCEKLDPPPGVLATIQADLAGLSYPEVIQKRNTQSPCAGCHARLDPIGVGFAQFDEAGYFDASVKISDYGLTPRFEGAADPELSSLADLAGKLSQAPELAECMAQKVFVYTQGRFPEGNDVCSVSAAGQRLVTDNYQFGSIVASLIESPAFRLRRVPQ
jgi:Protein of unknown function (DUF1592)/Protein of unknown function (DUF1588)/Protein of unknown function (DUF1587)/Protein of unknown function (DUF1585)/Protein of unknown function (DUF1595)